MGTFRGSGKDAAELRDARQEIKDLEGLLKEAREETRGLEGLLKEVRTELGEKDREIRELKAEVRRFEIRQSEMKTGGEFVESHGVLWQRSAAGKIESLAYCPTCRLVMTPMPSGYPEYFVCTSCKFKAPFHPEEIAGIMEALGD